ncbi:MAG TPA: hypothetical protein VG944_00075 [Fimbriimonas sp.]|nr:hypothetical protein [Fimbriimonas sp.]
MNLKTTLVASFAVFSPFASAQFGPGMTPPNTEYMPALFMNQKVVADMHLSPAVAQQEQSILIQEGMKMLSTMGNRGQSVDRVKMAKAALAAYKSMSDKSLAPLTPAQRVRYRQLSLQFFGPLALIQPKVTKQLEITPAQHAKMVAIIAKNSRQVAASMPKPGSNANGYMSGYQNVMQAQARARASEEAQMKAVLTRGQRAKWAAMQGRILPGIDNPLAGFGGMMGGMH